MSIPTLSVSNNSTSDQVKKYLNTLPANLTKEALEGFAFHAILTTGLTGNPFFGIGCGILSALATTIHAVITPLFKKINVGNSLAQEMLRGGSALVLTYSLSMVFGNNLAVKKLCISIIAYGLLLLNKQSEYTDTNRANKFIIWA